LVECAYFDMAWLDIVSACSFICPGLRWGEGEGGRKGGKGGRGENREGDRVPAPRHSMHSSCFLIVLFDFQAPYLTLIHSLTRYSSSSSFPPPLPPSFSFPFRLSHPLRPARVHEARCLPPLPREAHRVPRDDAPSLGAGRRAHACHELPQERSQQRQSIHRRTGPMRHR